MVAEGGGEGRAEILENRRKSKRRRLQARDEPMKMNG